MKRLRRKHDGMIFGWNEEMAKNADFEEFDHEGEVKQPDTASGPQIEGAVVEEGYPHTGKAKEPLEPFGQHKPTPIEAKTAKIDPALAPRKENEPAQGPEAQDMGNADLSMLFGGEEETAEKQAAKRDTRMRPTGKTS